MSTAAKVAIGCAAILVVVGVAGFAVVGAGVWFASRKAQELAEGVEAQQRATEVIRDLERSRAFSPPGDGVVTDDLARRFFAVTDGAWADLEDWVADMERRGERVRGSRLADVGDALAGLGGLARARVVLADALQSNGMAASEYVWTGLSLARAYEELDTPESARTAPAANRALAQRHRDRLTEIAGPDAGARRGMIFAVALTWGSVDGAFPLVGWDTLPEWAH